MLNSFGIGRFSSGKVLLVFAEVSVALTEVNFVLVKCLAPL